MRASTTLLLAGVIALPLGLGVSRSSDLAVCQVTIKSPGGGQMVGPFTPVTGTVSARAAAAGDGTVFVVIHPDKDYYHVAPVAHVSRDEWLSAAQFGIPATPRGFHFEMRAFVAPATALKEGDRLSGFPDAACASNLVHVLRD